MGTKSNRRRKEKVDSIAVSGHNFALDDTYSLNSMWRDIECRSVIISTIIHTVVLLTLAMIIYTEKSNSPPVLQISFSETSDLNEISMEPIQAMSLPSVPDNTEEPDTVDIATADQPPTTIQIETPITNEIFNTTDPISSLVNNNPSILLQSLYDSNTTIHSSDFKIEEESQNVNNILSDLISFTQSGISANSQNIKKTLLAGDAVGDNDFAHRLSKAGAQTGDVQISIAWNSIDDIDLHVTVATQKGTLDNINWTHRIGNFTHGMLDIDMNAHESSLVRNPVENIFWPNGSSPTGVFNVYIHYYRSWSGNRNVPVSIRIKNGKNIRVFNVTAVLGRSPQLVMNFVRH